MSCGKEEEEQKGASWRGNGHVDSRSDVPKRLSSYVYSSTYAQILKLWKFPRLLPHKPYAGASI